MTEPTNEQMLSELIDLAVEYGYNGYVITDSEDTRPLTEQYAITVENEGFYVSYDPEYLEEGYTAKFSENDVIFDHEFAKAVYGNSSITDFNGDIWYRWQYHLQQQALSDNPLKYMYEKRRK